MDWRGQPTTRGLQAHIDAMKAYVEKAGGRPPKIVAHPIKFGSGEWTCVIGEFADGSRIDVMDPKKKKTPIESGFPFTL